MNYSKILFSVAAIALFLVAATVNAGPKMEIAEDSWLEAAFLGQAHYSMKDNAADEEDFYLRRGRIILKGQMMDGVKFFMETDNDNAGKNGAAVASTDVQDAWMDVRVCETEDYSVWVQGGLILLPFSLENRASAASLLGIDYNAEAIKFVNSFVWRDYGAELHGKVGKLLAYRVGAFDGYDAPNSVKNDAAPLRYTGRVDVNVLVNVESGGWFYSQNRLGNKGEKYLVVGAGVDSQDEATSTAVDVDDPTAGSVVEDNDAWVVDFQSSVGLGEDLALLVNGAFYEWDNASFKGNTAFVEAGVLKGKTMLTGKMSMSDPDAGMSTDDFTAGLHYFIKGQNARIGVEHRWGDSADWTLAGIQFLL